MRPGPRNLITDVGGVLVGNAESEAVLTGSTVLVCERPSVASVSIMGGAPGTRESDLLAPEQTVEGVDAIVLSGGSAFGLDAGAGAMQYLADAGRGFAVGSARVPIVPGAILFDLLNGGDKSWGAEAPYRALGKRAAASAAADFSIGSAGAGFGATTATVKGGLGSASTRLAGGATVGALVAVNAVGSPIVGEGPHFWAAPFELDAEFGGLGPSPAPPAEAMAIRTKDVATPRASTTIAIVATDLALTKAQAKRLAVAAHDGLARALWPAHTPMDGDLVYGVATALRPADNADWLTLGAVAAATLTRAVARAVYHARPDPRDIVRPWQELFSTARPRAAPQPRRSPQ